MVTEEGGGEARIHLNYRTPQIYNIQYIKCYKYTHGTDGRGAANECTYYCRDAFMAPECKNAAGNEVFSDITRPSIQESRSCEKILMYILSSKKYEDLDVTQRSERLP